MGKLVLIRHGQSRWNAQNRFTGWVDIPLSEKGIRDAKKAGKLLANMKFDIAYTSELLRAHTTLFGVLNANKNVENYYFKHGDKMYDKYTSSKSDKKTIDIIKAWELNERDYGNLKGLNKLEMAKKFGEEKVHKWRRSFSTRPPGGESLKDTCERTIPYFKKNILARVKKGENVIVSAHGNSLRSIIKFLDNISDEDIPNLELGFGVPYLYNIDEKGKVKSKKVLS